MYAARRTSKVLYHTRTFYLGEIERDRPRDDAVEVVAAATWSRT